MIKQAPFHTGFSKYRHMSNQISKDATNNQRWGNTIRKLFFNSNGVSLLIDESSNPIVFSLDATDHSNHTRGLCIGTR